MLEFFQRHWIVITFYAVLILLIYLNRSKFEFQGKIIALLRTNTGVKWMMRWGKHHSKLVRVIGSIGVIAGFLGMLIIVGFLVHGLYTAFFVPSAPPVISPILPGVSIPGSPITLPLFEGLIALFVVIVIHEAAHGLVAAAHGMRVVSSGLVLFGPIPGAFVEPDEKQLTKAKPWARLSVFAAGPWSNMILAIVALGAVVGMGALVAPMTEVNGLSFTTIQDASPAALAGLDTNATYVMVNDATITGPAVLLEAITTSEPGDQITLVTNESTSYPVTLGAYDDTGDTCLGISGIYQVAGPGDLRIATPILAAILGFIEGTLFWIFALSLGLGLANLLPIGPLDGGQMTRLAANEWLGEERGTKLWSTISLVLLGIVIILLVVPIVRDLLPTEAIIHSCLPV